ncbi:MAG: hypothetical protein EPN89_11865 [Methylovulum sp.]|nr:MAG: hypothetical protein EPN89_11865 [Methylovulum sp.]
MNPDNYKDSEMMKRAFAIIRVLGGLTFHGLTTGEIAKATGSDHGTAIRMIAIMMKHGVVQETKIPERYRLGPFMVQLALAHQHDIQTCQADLDEIKQRYSRKP